METLKPIFPSRGRAALLATACLIVPLKGGEPRGSGGFADQELSRRAVMIDEAQELLLKGDQAYQAGRYGEAAEAFEGARDRLPDAPVSAELRAAATERLATATTENARGLSRTGDLAGAKLALDKVLDPNVAPDHPGAKTLRGQLDDPIRNNPALTAAHAKDVDAVRKLLYTAEGAYNLGKYDEAKHSYEEVLRIDAFNSAARRGMERLSKARTDYQNAAYDEARATMLGQVEGAWELKVPPADPGAALGDLEGNGSDTGSMSISALLETIVIPRVSLDQASFDEAIDFLRSKTTEIQDGRAINFTVNLGNEESEAAKKIRATRFDLRLSQVPVSQVMRYIANATQTSYTTDEFSVIISPVGSTTDAMITRIYKVSPDFLGSISGSAPAATAAADPFADAPSGGGLLAKKLGAKEALISQGISFPEGASANYNPGAGTLRIVNTSPSQDQIAQLVEQIGNTEPVMVSVKFTMIKIQQTRLEELGFDWILDNFGFGGPSFIPGQAKLNLTGGTVGNSTEVDDINLPTSVTNARPITAGNRSGDGAILGNSIDQLISQNNFGRQASARAPGVFGVNGVFDDTNVQMLMRGLDQKKGVDLMAEPATVTRSGQAASIHIVREFIYPTEYEPPELPNDTGGDSSVTTVNGVVVSSSGGGSSPVTPAHPTAFEKRDVGTILEVLPVADATKRFVEISLNPSFTDFDGFVNYGSPINTSAGGIMGNEMVELTRNAILMPVFSAQKLNTSVTIADGQTIVLGGLVQETIQDVQDKTPILGDVPIVGRLFQSKARQPVTNALIFLVKVELMDPTGRPYRDR